MTIKTSGFFGAVNRLNETYRQAHGLGSSTRGNPVLVAGERRDADRSEADVRAAKRECKPNYTYRLTAAPGLFVGPEIEVEVETRVVGRHYPNLEIEAVWIDAWKMEGRAIKELGSVDLLKSDVPYLYELGHAIVEAVGLDDDWMAEQMGWHGYTLITRGANDPDARWHRQAFEREE